MKNQKGFIDLGLAGWLFVFLIAVATDKGNDERVAKEAAEKCEVKMCIEIVK